MSDPAPAIGAPPATEATLVDPIRGRFEVRVTADSHFGWIRTRLSVERTLIGFGFAIVQFFDRMQQMPGVIPPRFPDAPRYLGLALILCGVLALVVSIWEYHWTLRYLWGGDFTPIAGMTKEGKQTPIVAIAVLLILIGTFAFGAVLLRFV
jgi:putative membrane protein